MDEIQVGSWIVNALLGIAVYFMKQAHDETKDKLRNLREDLNTVRETTFKKEDFKEFKEELWRRLDKYEASVERRLSEKQ